MNDVSYSEYLPLSEATFYVLMVLTEPLHGYAIMQKVEDISEGNVIIGPGALYCAFSTLEKQGLISKVREEERRKYYELSDKGRLVLAEHIRRMEIMFRNAQLALPKLKTEGVK